MKKIMKKILTLGFAVTLAATGLTACGSSKELSPLEAVKDRGVLRVATGGAFAPMSFINTKDGANETVGSDIDLAQYIADQMGVELEVTTVDTTATGITGVNEGKFDIVIYACAYTEERAQSLDLTSLYYVEEGSQRMAVREEDVEKYATPEDFSGTVVGCVAGGFEEQLAVKYLPEDITLKYYDQMRDALIALEEGKVDGVSVVASMTNLYIGNNPDCGLALCDWYFPVDDTAAGACMILKKDSGDLYDFVEEIANDVRDSGKYQEWYDNAFDLAVSLGIE